MTMSGSEGPDAGRFAAAEVARAVRRDFAPAEVAEAERLLAGYEEIAANEVRLAALRKARGRLPVLRSLMELARVDFRDVLN